MIHGQANFHAFHSGKVFYFIRGEIGKREKMRRQHEIELSLNIPEKGGNSSQD